MLNQFPKPVRIGAGVALFAVSIVILGFGVHMLLGPRNSFTKAVLAIGALGALMGVGLVGNALGMIKD